MNGPVLRPVPETGEYELVEAFDIGDGDSVPEGFRTDGASVPRLLWPVLGSPFDPGVVAAALEHDYRYRFGAWSRSYADEVFRRRLVEVGVVRGRALLYWLGVSAGGWLYWRRCRYGRGLTG